MVMLYTDSCCKGVVMSLKSKAADIGWFIFGLAAVAAWLAAFGIGGHIGETIKSAFVDWIAGPA